MNTGVQRSGATPAAANTATTRPVGSRVGNAFGTGKSLPVIAMAHEIPYVATATVADLHDLEHKVVTAMGMHGARYLHVLVPCPLGWGTDSADTVRIARLAAESGLFPVFEARDGEVTDVRRIRRQVPVEEYLRLRLGSPTCSATLVTPTWSPGCSGRPTVRSPTSGYWRRSRHDHSVRRSPSAPGRARPTSPAPGGPNARSTSSGSRRAATPAPRERTSAPGCTTRSPAAPATRRHGGGSWR